MVDEASNQRELSIWGMSRSCYHHKSYIGTFVPDAVHLASVRRDMVEDEVQNLGHFYRGYTMSRSELRFSNFPGPGMFVGLKRDIGGNSS